MGALRKPVAQQQCHSEGESDRSRPSLQAKLQWAAPKFFEIELEPREEKQKRKSERPEEGKHPDRLRPPQHVRPHDDAQSDLDHDDGQPQTDRHLRHERCRDRDQSDEKQRGEVRFHDRCEHICEPVGSQRVSSARLRLLWTKSQC